MSRATVVPPGPTWAGASSIRAGFVLVIGSWAAAALAQTAPAPSPPEAQAWIDVATLQSPGGMAGAMGGPGGPSVRDALGSLLGRGTGGGTNTFGVTAGSMAFGQSGKYVDVTLMSRKGPLPEATMNVPAAFLAPALKLQAPTREPARPVPPSDDEVQPIPETDRPKGRILLYWGCGATIRAGQPRIIDTATVTNPQELARLFQVRRATQRGAHSQPGRPLWPSPADARLVPANASLAGEHGFVAQGVPENFRFQIPPAHDVMPALNLQQRNAGGAIELTWTAATTARAHFATALGSTGPNDMVIWSSSEVPEMGFGLVDYQTNAAVDGWLRERVLLAPTASSCTIPQGIFPSGTGGMVSVIGYGSEMNAAYPPRPADRQVKWEPQWSVKVRVKTVASGLLGMPGATGGAGANSGGATPAAEAPPTPTPAADPPPPKLPGALDILRGVLGR
jgi:hypothetical protein